MAISKQQINRVGLCSYPEDSADSLRPQVGQNTAAIVQNTAAIGQLGARMTGAETAIAALQAGGGGSGGGGNGGGTTPPPDLSLLYRVEDITAGGATEINYTPQNDGETCLIRVTGMDVDVSELTVVIQPAADMPAGVWRKFTLIVKVSNDEWANGTGNIYISDYNGNIYLHAGVAENPGIFAAQFIGRGRGAGAVDYIALTQGSYTSGGSLAGL